jgi:hypothetical protein
MGPDEVVIVTPTRDDLPRFGQTEESMLIQALVAQSAVEAFDESVLHRFARLDILPSHPPRNPAQDRDTSQFTVVVADNNLGDPAHADELFEFAHHANAAERSIDHCGQAFTAEVIDDAENTEAPPSIKSVRDEVERPPFIDRAGQRQRRARAQGVNAG